MNEDDTTRKPLACFFLPRKERTQLSLQRDYKEILFQLGQSSSFEAQEHLGLNSYAVVASRTACFGYG